MAPARASARRSQQDSNPASRPSASDNDANIAVNDELFLEPMMGTPLQIYIEKDVEDRDDLVDLITVGRVLWFLCISRRVESPCPCSAR